MREWQVCATGASPSPLSPTPVGSIVRAGASLSAQEGWYDYEAVAPTTGHYGRLRAHSFRHCLLISENEHHQLNYQSHRCSAQAYIAAANPLNSAITTFGSQATKWNAQTTDSQAESEAQPVVTALQNMQKRLLGTIWPTSARKDVDTLLPAVGLMTGYLQALSSLNFVNVSSWESTFGRELSTVQTDTTAVREDLGLPATFRNGESF